MFIAAGAGGFLREVHLPVRVPLTPYDRLFLAGHLALREQSLPGHPILAILDLHGPLDSAELSGRFETAMARHPLLTSHIGYSRLTGRAHWRLDGPASTRSRPIIRQYDLSATADPEAERETLLRRLLNESLDPETPPHVRLHHVRFSEDRHVLVLHYGHYLMDLHGGWRLLREMATASTGAAESTPDYARLLQASRSRPHEWTGGRLRRWAQGVRQHRAWSRHRDCAPRQNGSTASPAGDAVRRLWSLERSAQIEQQARARLRAGPMLYTRHGLLAALLAVDELREPLGLRSESYMVAVPFARPGAADRPFTPINDLTVATIVMPRRLLSSPADADDELARQLTDYRNGGDQATWALMQYAGWLRNGHYRLMLRKGRGVPPCSFGYTLYQVETDDASCLGARIERFSATGLPTIPPGLMMTCTRFARRWSLCCTFFPHIWPRPLVERLTERVDFHLGA